MGLKPGYLWTQPTAWNVNTFHLKHAELDGEHTSQSLNENKFVQRGCGSRLEEHDQNNNTSHSWQWSKTWSVTSFWQWKSFTLTSREATTMHKSHRKCLALTRHIVFWRQQPTFCTAKFTTAKSRWKQQECTANVLGMDTNLGMTTFSSKTCIILDLLTDLNIFSGKHVHPRTCLQHFNSENCAFTRATHKPVFWPSFWLSDAKPCTPIRKFDLNTNFGSAYMYIPYMPVKYISGANIQRLNPDTWKRCFFDSIPFASSIFFCLRDL